MSKGLGWLEKAVLGVVGVKKQEPSVWVIAKAVFGGEDWEPPTNSQLKATHRAIKSLSRRGLLIAVIAHVLTQYSDCNRGGCRQTYVFRTLEDIKAYLVNCPRIVRRLEMPDGRLLVTESQKESDRKTAELLKTLGIRR
ncbi:hypothetical protein ES703_111727 [subsurface metagenome]